MILIVCSLILCVTTWSAHTFLETVCILHSVLHQYDRYAVDESRLYIGYTGPILLVSSDPRTALNMALVTLIAY